MFMKSLLLVAGVAAARAAGGDSLPKNFVTCHDNDNLNNCLIAAVPDALMKMQKGVPSLSVPSMEPLHVSGITIDSGAGPVRISQIYKNVRLHGLTTSKLNNYKAELPHYRLRTESITPKMEFIADYVMKGRILVLPIQGKGVANITMVNLVVKHDLVGEPVKRDGQTFMHIKEYRVEFIPERVILYFSNLFNGDKRLGDQMNLFLNQNSELVFNELKDSYESSLSSVFKAVTNKIFDSVPMNKIFPKEEKKKKKD